jgi:flagellar basal-body rod protein FlgC
MNSADLNTSVFRGNIYSSFDIAASGMTVQRRKMDTVSSNIANISVTHVDGGGPYLRRQVVMSLEPPKTFAQTLKRASLKMETTEPGHIPRTRTSGDQIQDIPLVKGSEIEMPNQRKNVVYDPTHPDADSDGYVVYPDINIVEEMVDLMNASREFDANVTVIEAAKGMITKSLEI